MALFRARLGQMELLVDDKVGLGWGKITMDALWREELVGATLAGCRGHLRYST
ncbi:hypothetical protein [Litoreibacter albidus]|uniref:hypothetical protein n=1 Tax=Litoreibacter albidus TaxID=670155 RepID=UPI003735635F